MKYETLSKVNSPADLKALNEAEIPALCEEIREFLVENVEKTGGHLASNLGVTELSVAIHRVFDSPNDHIIFDVGHQSYVHKILTGRKNDFSTLRRIGGISGFTKISESPHDAFGAGHSSTSVSAALGFANADRLNGKSNFTVAVLGDGAYTGGMVHEALNNCDPELKLVIILNENGMSISLNKGTFATYLSKVRVSKGYMSWKHGTVSVLNRIPIIGSALRRLLTYVRTKIKNLIYSSNYFEDLGLYYMGPIDGNDYKKLEKTLNKAKSLNKCVVVHLKTVKGKGYAPAEDFPDKFHGVSSTSVSNDNFHSKCVDEIINLAKDDKKIVAVTAAMGMGTGLDKFGNCFHDRYYDVGIAEGHALTFSAGLAAAGLKPFVAIYSTFLQRGYDSIVHDIALQNLPVKILVDRAGISHGDGATHHGIFDVSFLSHIPGIEIFSPVTYESLQRAVKYAAESTVPVAIRYSNTNEPSTVTTRFSYIGKTSDWIKTDFDISSIKENLFITYGNIASTVVLAADVIKDDFCLDVGIVLLERLKPYDELAKAILPYINNAKNIIFVEEGIKNGGAGMLLREAIASENPNFANAKYHIAAIEDNFAAPTHPCNIYDYLGLSVEALVQKMNSMVKEKEKNEH